MKTIFLSAIISILTFIQPRLLIAAEIPSQLKALHVLNRLGFGPRPGDIERVNAMGVENYIHQQLFPETIPEPSTLTKKLNELTTYSLGPVELFEKYGPLIRASGQKNDPDLNEDLRRKAGLGDPRLILREASQARLMQAIESPRQLQEVMVDFWYNHFNVYAHKSLDKLWIGNYEREAIRPYVFGHFRDLLGATAKHPAMLLYLDNWENVGPDSFIKLGDERSHGLNENYARELMELHTLGINGGYTQEDVIALTRILTGWGFLDKPRGRVNLTFEFYFNGRFHDNSDKIFLGQKIKGDGEREVEKVLDILAKSPATARHISFQLAQYFVSDDPDPALVDRLAQKFEETDGDIRAVLQTIFQSPQFWDEKNDDNKFKTPYQYIVSVVRASGEEVTDYKPLTDILYELGMPIYEYETPDGYKNTQEAWVNGDGMLRRINFVSELALGEAGINGDDLPIAYKDLMSVIGDSLSSSTTEVIKNTPASLRAALVLGSPEMMKK